MEGYQLGSLEHRELLASKTSISTDSQVEPRRGGGSVTVNSRWVVGADKQEQSIRLGRVICSG